MRWDGQNCKLHEEKESSAMCRDVVLSVLHSARVAQRLVRQTLENYLFSRLISNTHSGRYHVPPQSVLDRTSLAIASQHIDHVDAALYSHTRWSCHWQYHRLPL